MEITRMDPGLKDQVALVDFSATWCGPCRQMTPVVKDLAQKYQGKVAVVEIDIDFGRMWPPIIWSRAFPH